MEWNVMLKLENTVKNTYIYLLMSLNVKLNSNNSKYLLECNEGAISDWIV